MKLAVIGTGYVGLVSGVCFAEKGNHVICVDSDADKINRLNQYESPIYEPKIEAFIERNLKAERLEFTTNMAEAIKHSDIIILAVGTPSLDNGAADLSYIKAAVKEIAEAMDGYKIILTKSTVPVGTNEILAKLVSTLTAHPFDFVSAPEFLREGTAIEDTMHPDRIIIGLEKSELAATMIALHLGFSEQIFITDIRSAEMIKYASNAFLATKISFINEIANICEKVGADVTEVSKGMGLDRRIGNSFLQAGIGYGGSCFPKDTKALIQIAGNVNYAFKLLESVVEVNKGQRFQIIAKLRESLHQLRGATIGIWGLSFKPNTDDIRDAPSLEIIELLVQEGVKLKLYDPIAMDKFKKVMNHPSIKWCTDAYAAAEGCDAVCLLTDWTEFSQIDLPRMAASMQNPILIDGRNVYSKGQIESSGLEYYSIGRPHINQYPPKTANVM